MSDAVSFATSLHIPSVPAAADGGHGKHRGSASSSEESRTTAGPGKHRRPSGGAEEAVA